MANLYTLFGKKESTNLNLPKEDISSILYHDIFDYPLSFAELIKWKCGELATNSKSEKKIKMLNGFYFVDGRQRLVYKRLLRTRISDKKIEIAKRVSKIISMIPTVKMIGITGSLAMKNSEESGDIDLLIITKAGSLWTTRALVLFTLKLFGVATRRFGDKNQKDKICLNMWMDKSDLVWKSKNRNIYSAHEIAQIVPLINKEKTHERLLKKNEWILKYWPKSVRVAKKLGDSPQKIFLPPLEKILFNLQYKYMKNKISRETVTTTRALFHPQDWTRIVLGRLST